MLQEGNEYEGNYEKSTINSSRNDIDIRDKIRLELVQVDVETAIESQ